MFACCLVIMISALALTINAELYMATTAVGDLIECNITDTTTTITIPDQTGPFGIGFGASSMGGTGQGTYTVIVVGTNLTEQLTSSSPRGLNPIDGQDNWSMSSVDGKTYLTRDSTINGCSQCFQFSVTSYRIGFIYAKANTVGTFGGHDSNQRDGLAFNYATTEAPTSDPSEPPTTAEPSVSPTNMPSVSPTTAEPSVSPTAVTGAPTADADYEACVVAEDLLTGLEVTIKRHVSQETLKIVMTGPTDDWFGFGFGALTMSGTYAVTVEGDTTTVSERVLGNHNSGSVITAGSITDTAVTTDGSTRTVTITRPYSSDGAGDFTELLCDVDAMNLIAARGSGNSLGTHTERASGTITRVCDCADEDPGSSSAHSMFGTLSMVLATCIAAYVAV